MPLNRVIWDLLDIWRHTVGLCGNYYLGSDLKPMLSSVLNYKRFCDNFIKAFIDCVLDDEERLDYNFEYEDYQYVKQQISLPFKIEKNCLFIEIIEQEDLDKSLDYAIREINRLNIGVPSFETITPLPHIQDPIETTVLKKWFSRIKDIDMSSSSIDDTDWKYIIDTYAKEKRRG